MKKNKGPMKWVKAPDIKKKILHFKKGLNIDWIKTKNIYCFRSYKSTSRAYARIWGLSRIWQIALNEKPSYVIEVLSENFDKLNEREKDKVLLHEITHIPKNFSGALIPHIRKRGKRNFYDKVNELYNSYLKRI